MRKILDQAQIHPEAMGVISQFHTAVVEEAARAVSQHEWVVFGMTQNPYVKKARQYLEAKNLPFHYIEHGSYFSKWKMRLAIKLWSGWATFPQVFHKGKLIGGYKDLQKYLP